VTERQFLEKVRLACETLGDHVQHIVIFDDGSADGVIGLADVEGAPHPDFDFEASWR
jgi:hypothetical protein